MCIRDRLEAATGCSVDRGGRVVVAPDFSIASHPEIRIAGDLCSYSHTQDGHPLPGMAAPAKQAGSFIGKDIAAVVAGRPRPKFRYLDLGSMAIVDGSSAVADLRGLKFSGLIGVLLWAGVHLGLIHDMQQRGSLATKWVFALITRQRASMLLTGMPSQHIALNAADAHFPMQNRSRAINCFPQMRLCKQPWSTTPRKSQGCRPFKSRTLKS